MTMTSSSRPGPLSPLAAVVCPRLTRASLMVGACRGAVVGAESVLRPWHSLAGRAWLSSYVVAVTALLLLYRLDDPASLYHRATLFRLPALLELQTTRQCAVSY